MTYLNMRLTFGATSEPLLLDMSSLLYDYELFYDYHVLTMVEEYNGYSFSQYFWYRNGRPIDKQDKLQIRYIQYGSPFILGVAVIGWVAVKVVTPLVRVSGEIADWPADRRIKKAEAVKAQLEAIEKAEDVKYKQLRNERAGIMIERARYQTEEEKLKLEEKREKRKVDTLRQLGRRLSENKYQLVDLSTSIEGDKPKELEK